MNESYMLFASFSSLLSAVCCHEVPQSIYSLRISIQRWCYVKEDCKHHVISFIHSCETEFYHSKEGECY
jgi:hypothetical protein